MSEEAARLVRHVAWHVMPPEDRDLPGADAVRRVGLTVDGDARGWWARHGEQLLRSLEDGLPVPVMAASGAGQYEVRWTQYLRHMLDPLASHGLGETLSRTLIETITGGRSIGPIAVHAELGLEGRACGHEGCEATSRGSVDLVVMDEKTCVAIEQKVTSAESRWICEHGHNNGQLRSYYDRLNEMCAGQERCPPRCLYLTRTGTDSADEGWMPIAHAQLASIFAQALDQTRGLRRAALLGLIIDLNTGLLGDWRRVCAQLRRLLLPGGDRRPAPVPLDIAASARNLLAPHPTLAQVLGVSVARAPSPTAYLFEHGDEHGTDPSGD